MEQLKVADTVETGPDLVAAGIGMAAGIVLWAVLEMSVQPATAIELVLCAALFSTSVSRLTPMLSARLRDTMAATGSFAVLIGAVRWLGAGIAWWIGLAVLIAGAAAAFATFASR